jgi:tRNA (guanine-N7-)-methyltransferase
MTPSQQRALEALWPKFGIEHGLDLLNLDTVFGRSADKILEVGFGNGDTLVQAAIEHPEFDFLGVDVHKPGIGHCLLEAHSAGIDNLRVIAHDAMEVLENQIANNTLARINLLFPDPWPKKRHHKRRIVNTPFLDLAVKKLRAGGALFIATDWGNYAQHIDAVMAGHDNFSLIERREHDGNQPLDRHTTKFESRGLGKGHRIVDWQYMANPPAGQ